MATEDEFRAALMRGRLKSLRQHLMAQSSWFAIAMFGYGRGLRTAKDIFRAASIYDARRRVNSRGEGHEQ